MPKERISDFEPQVEPKYKKNISKIEGKTKLEATLQFRDVRPRDERSPGLGADQGHLRL